MVGVVVMMVKMLRFVRCARGRWCFPGWRLTSDGGGGGDGVSRGLGRPGNQRMRLIREPFNLDQPTSFKSVKIFSQSTPLERDGVHSLPGKERQCVASCQPRGKGWGIVWS